VIDRLSSNYNGITNGPPGSNHGGAGGSYPAGCAGSACVIGPPHNAFVDLMDGGPTGNLRSNLLSPMVWVNATGVGTATFQESYGALSSWQAWALGHDPLAHQWLSGYVKLYTDWCGDLAGKPPSYYCANYYYVPSTHDSSLLNGYPSGIGAAFNGTDTTDMADVTPVITITGGSPTVAWSGDNSSNQWANGDLVKYAQCVPGSVNEMCNGSALNSVDQLNTTTWYSIWNVSQSGGSGTFQIINPNTGSPFISFTNGGNPLTSGSVPIVVRHLTAPSTGFSHPSYMAYIQALIYGLKDIGYSSQMASLISMINTRGFYDPTNDIDTGSWLNWDPNVVVP
jgi:hypothetical protein